MLKTLKILSVATFTIIQIMSSKFEMNENTTLLINILCGMVLISVYSYEVFKGDKDSKKQDLFIKVSTFLHTINLLHKDGSQEQSDLDIKFDVSSLLYKTFTPKEIKEIKKLNYFPSNLNVEEYENYSYIFNIINKIIGRLERKETLRLDKPKEDEHNRNTQ
ncbi:MAG: hypothetical protein ACYDCN_08975 [Bacteroidia bacterium]